MEVFDIAISLSHTQLDLATELRARLVATGLREQSIFLYPDAKLKLASLHLPTELPDIYRSARLIVVLHDEGYAKSHYAQAEFEVVAERILEVKLDSILVFTCDDTPLPKAFGRHRLSVPLKDPTDLEVAVKLIKQRLDGIRPRAARPRRPALGGAARLIAFAGMSTLGTKRLQQVARIVQQHVYPRSEQEAEISVQVAADLLQLEQLAREAQLLVCYEGNKRFTDEWVKHLRNIPEHEGRVILIGSRASATSPTSIHIEWSNPTEAAVQVLQRVEAVTGQAVSLPGQVPEPVRRHYPMADTLFADALPCENRSRGRCERRQTSLALAYTLGLGEQGARLARVRGLLDGINTCARELGALPEGTTLGMDYPHVKLLLDRTELLFNVFKEGRREDEALHPDPANACSMRLQKYLEHHTQANTSDAIPALCRALTLCYRWYRGVRPQDRTQVRSAAEEIHSALFGALSNELRDAAERMFQGRTVIRQEHVRRHGDHCWGLGSHIQGLHSQLKRKDPHVGN